MRKPWLVLVLTAFLASFSLAAGPPLRLSVLEGEAAVKHEGSDEWVPLEPNFPIAEGDRIVVQAASRVEIETGSRAVVRLDAGSDLQIESLQPLKLALYGGSAILRTGSQEVRLVTPSLEVRLFANGRYRFDVRDSSAQATVFKGVAEIAGEQFQTGAAVLMEGEQILGKAATVVKADQFQRWSERRDSAYAFDKSAQYLPSTTLAGVSELDSYGTWSYSSMLGHVWYPSVNFGWSPYRQGHWYSSPYFGWTWISAEPWGWLPYHYGRWTLTSNGWCWVPGNASYFNTWSPSLVYFLRSDHFVGWFPLGPGDRVSAAISNLRRGWGSAYANWGTPGGLVFLPVQRFARGEGPLPGVVAADWNLGNGQVAPDVSDIRPQTGLWSNPASPSPTRSRALWGYSRPSGVNGGANPGFQYPANPSIGLPTTGGSVIPQQGGSRIVIPQEGMSRVVVPRREIPSSNDRPTLASPRPSYDSGSSRQGGPLWGQSSSGGGLWGSPRSSGSKTDDSTRRRP